MYYFVCPFSVSGFRSNNGFDGVCNSNVCSSNVCSSVFHSIFFVCNTYIFHLPLCNEIPLY